MKRTPKYVALDVHQATTVVSVREPGGRVIARSILPTEAAALVEFFRGMRGSIQVRRKGRRPNGCMTCWCRWSARSWSATGGASTAGTRGISGMPTSSRTDSSSATCARCTMAAGTG